MSKYKNTVCYLSLEEGYLFSFLNHYPFFISLLWFVDFFLQTKSKSLLYMSKQWVDIMYYDSKPYTYQGGGSITRTIGCQKVGNGLREGGRGGS